MTGAANPLNPPTKTRIKIKLGGRVVKNTTKNATSAALHHAEQVVAQIEPIVAKLGIQHPLEPLPASWSIVAKQASKRPRTDDTTHVAQPSTKRSKAALKTPSGESCHTLAVLEEGQLPPLDTPQERTNNNASFQQCMSGMLELQQGARKLTGDFNAAVKEGQDKKRYSDAAIKRNRNRTSPAAFMFVLQSAIAFLEAALLAQHSNKTSTSDIVMLLQQTLIMLEACLSKEDTSMPPTQLLAFKLVARKLMTAIAMRIAQISRPSGKDAAKQVLNAARDPTVRDPFRDKPSPGDSNVSSETSNGRAHSLLHDCATKCADLVLVQARVIEYASLSAQLQASFAAEMQRGRAKEGATLAMHAQMLGADLAAGSGEVLLHVARQTLGVLEGFVNAMEAKM